MIKVLFDSNVWRKIVIPNNFKDDPSKHSYDVIHNAIIEDFISPFLSETIFSIEAIKRIGRLSYLSNYKPAVSNSAVINNDDANVKISLGPDISPIVLSTNSYNQQYYDEAVKMGFKIVRLPRIAGFNTEGIQITRLMSAQYENASTIGTRIENRGAGFSQLYSLVMNYAGANFLEKIINAPQEDWRKIASAMAEWADGDSVSIAIGLGCDYLCTEDNAKNAGPHSIFSGRNRNWIQKEYSIRIVSPDALAIFCAGATL